MCGHYVQGVDNLLRPYMCKPTAANCGKCCREEEKTPWGGRGGVTFKLRWEETSQGQEQQKPARQRQEGLLCMRPLTFGRCG